MPCQIYHIWLADDQSSILICRVYNERQQLNQQIVAQLTGNAAAMKPLEVLSLKQEYITPHSRANIVHAEKHQQLPHEPVACPVLVKTEYQATDTDMQSVPDQLPALLAKLEHNLEQELRHISEQDYVTLTKMLKPVQVCLDGSVLHKFCLELALSPT